MLLETGPRSNRREFADEPLIMRINSKGENMMVIAEKGLQIPVGYKPELSLKETEKAIKDVKDFFEKGLAAEIELA